MDTRVETPTTLPSVAAAEKRRLAALAKKQAATELLNKLMEERGIQRKVKKKAKAEIASRIAKLLIDAAKILNMGVTFGKNPLLPSCTIRMKLWAEFKAELDIAEMDFEEKAAAAKMFSILSKMVQFLSPNGSSTLVVQISDKLLSGVLPPVCKKGKKRKRGPFIWIVPGGKVSPR